MTGDVTTRSVSVPRGAFGRHRRDRAARWLVAVTLVVVALAVAAVLRGAALGPSSTQRDRHAEARALQQLVGGLGLGGETHLGRCATAFDPRVRRSCSHCGTALPSGAVFCPAHAFSILHLQNEPLGQSDDSSERK